MAPNNDQEQQRKNKITAVLSQGYFPLFQQLPPEIRRHIWQEALCEWAVWYTSHPHVNLQASGLFIRMRPVGIAPFHVGLACQESRHLMEGLYTKLLAGGGGSAASPAAVYWLIPERTITYLGCTARAVDFLDIIHAHQSLPLRHLVLHWSDLLDVTRFSHNLVYQCPDLQTLTLHAADRGTTPELCRCDSPLSQHLADWYITVASWQDETLPYVEHPESEMLNWSVGEYFGDRNEEAAQVISNSGHDDMIHDAVLDYYGRKLATCSSDRTIRIFEIEGESQRLIETLKGHEGAVWCVAWAHPKYGNILASAGYDGKVFIWKEQGPQHQWQRIYDFPLHKASVNIVSWAPHEAGCLLACASSDGNVSVLEFKDSAFDNTTFPAHGLGVNSVSWAPATAPGSIVSSSPGPAAAGNRRFVTGGSDNVVKIWAFDPATQSYKQEGEALTGHSDWVRDVAWSPTVLKRSYIASASQDKTVRIWTADSTAGGPAQWDCKTLDFEAPVWRVSWSLSGNVLAVSGADNKVSLWKENLRGEWECVKKIED
ncbi:transport SEC13 [Cordyceps militaris]|uniref:Protein transport protein SEC13 n=1 Tax=Cordyceps militaris TaxID=73501 RepID=A0A2H4SR98_CORMI|nr:transport SEC13 [Cordyceps militaris]